MYTIYNRINCSTNSCKTCVDGPTIYEEVHLNVIVRYTLH